LLGISAQILIPLFAESGVPGCWTLCDF